MRIDRTLRPINMESDSCNWFLQIQGPKLELWNCIVQNENAKLLKKELRFKNKTCTSHGSSWHTWHDCNSAKPSLCKFPCIYRTHLLSPYPYQRAVVVFSTRQFFFCQLCPCFVFSPSVLCPPSSPPVVVKKDILQLKWKFHFQTIN